MWTLVEQEAVHNLLTTHNALRSALEKFCQARAEARNADCAQAMRTVPRKWELAADYAAKAEVYSELLKELERESARQDSAGPTG